MCAPLAADARPYLPSPIDINANRLSERLGSDPSLSHMWT